MRLSSFEQQAIQEAVAALDPKAEVYLFGSRANSNKKGGDIVVNQQADYLENLRELSGQLALARDWLLRSYKQCEIIGTREVYEPEHYDHFENLASRFARASDLLLQKIFRGIDLLELSEGGSLLDAIHRAEKF